jgi:predicted dehydrogenase
MDAAGSALDVAVVGIGRMGSHHARVYHEHQTANLVAVVDCDAQRAAETARRYGCNSYANVGHLIDHHPALRAASVVVPTDRHRDVAAPLLRAGVACLIEKPLAGSSADARALATLAEDRGAVLQVGHTERFNPAVQAIAAMNITPRFVEVQRISPMSFRSMDVSVVMDMMIHDLDIVLMLAGALPTRVDATGIAVFGPHEDLANARLVFANGCVANLTSSRLALKTERKLRLFSEEAYVSLDYQAGNGMVIRKSDNAEILDKLRNSVAAGEDLTDLDYAGLVQAEQLRMDGNGERRDPLTDQISSFLISAAAGGDPQVNAVAGCAAVETAERVMHALRQHRWEGMTGV